MTIERLFQNINSMATFQRDGYFRRQYLSAGLDTMLGEGGQELSTGEKQLLSFARVLCRDPRILVLDEATAAIDTESENILEAAMATAFAGRTSLIIAHRLSTIKRASRIIVMAHGRIVEEGRHDELLALGGIYAGMVALDMKTVAGGGETLPGTDGNGG